LFELFKSTFPPKSLSFKSSHTNSKHHSSLETFLFAAMSKSIASTITYPFILAKARMQVSERRNLTPIRVLRRIIKEEGWQVNPTHPSNNEIKNRGPLKV
jgi:Mitochondrial carrier protein